MPQLPEQRFSIIAKIGSRYRRIITVVRTNSTFQCFVKTWSRTLDILSASQNYTALKHELALVAIYSEEENVYRSERSTWFQYSTGWPVDRNWSVPWPFIQTCLEVGVSCIPEIGELHDAVTTWDSNITGLRHAVFDITDPKNPRYCFTGVSERHRRFSLQELIKESHPETLMCLKPFTDRSEDFELISLEALYQVWPDFQWETGEPLNPPFQGSIHSEGQLSRSKGSKGKEEQSPYAVPSLTHLSLERFVLTVLPGEEYGEDALKFFVTNQRCRRILREYLLQHTTWMESTYAIGDLLKAAFADMEHVDLSSWPLLSINVISDILTWGPISHCVKVVSISLSLKNGDIDILAQALPERGIEELYILKGPKRNPKETKEDSGDHPNKVYYNPPLRRKVKGRIFLDAAFEFGLHKYKWLPSYKDIPFQPHDCPILQIIYRYERDFDSIFLGDAVLTPVRLVSGLFNLMRLWLEVPYSESFLSFELGAAKAFASAPSSLGETSVIEISPIASEAFRRGCERLSKGHVSQRFSGLRSLQQGAWTVVIDIHTRMAPSNAALAALFKVGFVQTVRHIKAAPSSSVDFQPHDIFVTDIRGFLSEAAPGADIGKVAALEESLSELGRELLERKLEEANDIATEFISDKSFIENLSIEDAYGLVKEALSWKEDRELWLGQVERVN